MLSILMCAPHALPIKPILPFSGCCVHTASVSTWPSVRPCPLAASPVLHPTPARTQAAPHAPTHPGHNVMCCSIRTHTLTWGHTMHAEPQQPTWVTMSRTRLRMPPQTLRASHHLHTFGRRHAGVDPRCDRTVTHTLLFYSWRSSSYLWMLKPYHARLWLVLCMGSSDAWPTATLSITHPYPIPSIPICFFLTRYCAPHLS